MSTAPPASLPIRTMTLAGNPATPDTPGPLVALARQGCSYALLNLDPEESPIWAMLSVLVSEDPFPGETMDGHEMIWLKTYSENAGIFEQLQRAGWLRDSGRKIQQGYATLPCVEVRLAESEIAHSCQCCEKFEGIEDPKRFLRCSKCRRTYYCSADCQATDWSSHKKICKDLGAGQFAVVENRRRKEVEGYLGGMGFKTLSM